nr:hypothetical protein Itr_chr14CG29070 [Ipomoea trifida]
MELVFGSHVAALWVVMRDRDFLPEVLGSVALLTCLEAMLPGMVPVGACEEFRAVMVELPRATALVGACKECQAVMAEQWEVEGVMLVAGSNLMVADVNSWVVERMATVVE